MGIVYKKVSKKKKNKSVKTQATAQKPSLVYLLLYAFKVFGKQNKFWTSIWLIFLVIQPLIPQIHRFFISNLIDQAVNIVYNTNEINREFIQGIILLTTVMALTSAFWPLNQFIGQVQNMFMMTYSDKVLLKKYLSLDPQTYENPNFINRKTKLDYNFWVIRDSLNKVANSLGLLILIFISSGLLWSSEPLIILFFSISLLPTIIITHKFGKIVWNIWDDKGEEKIIYGKYRNILYTDSLESFQEIKVLNYAKYLLAKAISIHDKFIRRLVNNEKKRLYAELFFKLWEYSFIGLAMFLLFRLYLTGATTIGNFYLLYGFIFAFRSSLNNLLRQVTNLQANKDVLYSFYSIMERKPSIKSGKHIIDTQKAVSIRFKDVWFKYPRTDRWIFKGINWSVNSDEDIALVGKNGAGKTTLIKLILRIYDPDKGSIFINDVNIKELDLDTYYRTVGLLSQSFVTVGITAKENIQLGNVERKPEMEAIKKAAKLAKVDNIIEKYPKKYNTFLSKNLKDGVLPSGGEWQRIAIARMFYRNPKLLILDEPTSAIDAIAEEEIFSNIQDHADNKTVIIVSHRFSTVKKANRIVVIDDGKIIEQGSHKMLMQNNGLYKKMYDKQINA